MSATIKSPKSSSLFALALALLVTASCTVRLVSAYDQVIDEGITDFHTKVTAVVGKMVTLSGKPEGTYDANQTSYPDFAAAISSLQMRAAQTPKNEITVQALGELASNLDRLGKLHHAGGDKGLSQALAGPALAAIDVQCESILKFEIAKKRGDEP
jgi:hypothetical protein